MSHRHEDGTEHEHGSYQGVTMNCPQCHTRPVPDIGGAPVLCPPCMRRCYATVHGPNAAPAAGTADRELWDLADAYLPRVPTYPGQAKEDPMAYRTGR